MIEAIAKRKSFRSSADKRVDAENVRSSSAVGVGYPAEDAELEAVGRFGVSHIHYNKY